MRASTASMILAFCAVVAVQAAPTSINSGSVIARGTNDFEYDAQGNESKLVFVWCFPFRQTSWATRDLFSEKHARSPPESLHLLYQALADYAFSKLRPEEQMISNTMLRAMRLRLVSRRRRQRRPRQQREMSTRSSTMRTEMRSQREEPATLNTTPMVTRSKPAEPRTLNMTLRVTRSRAGAQMTVCIPNTWRIVSYIEGPQ